MDAVASLACHSIPSWQGRVSGKITRAFNLHLQLGESTWCCQTFDFMISPTSLQLGVYFEKDKSFGKNTVRINLRVPNFQKFPGGACPQTPLAIACFACWLCFAQYIEATITHPHIVWPDHLKIASYAPDIYSVTISWTYETRRSHSHICK